MKPQFRSAVEREEYEREQAAKPIPMRLTCPWCCTLHIDEGKFATKPHHTHACQNCGGVWRPAIQATVGVRFLPGFEDAIAAPFKLGDCIRAKGETLTASVSEVLHGERMCRVCWHDDQAFGLVRWDEIELVPFAGRPDPARNEASGETGKST